MKNLNKNQKKINQYLKVNTIKNKNELNLRQNKNLRFQKQLKNNQKQIFPLFQIQIFRSLVNEIKKI